ncbi:tRNA pseudouridine synthase A [Neolewinella maritima]|uniref:tRNA pseudouridine synthase A n=1 Tax=Neolewinella maritima TaxID=1383882 RepID=A0ABM9B1X2_9BACT|nr:tRNA pseudouridine(38-40) synthase TruA [Neolewinella maritima]CAH1001192.1 tRNA pseudouridine synthase A [Neolewinella maritima]
MGHRYFVHLAYRGTHYRGWQRQRGEVITVQDTIERAGSRVQHQELKAVGCGRTDAGVHASDYYLHFDTTEPLRDQWLYIMNKLLPDDIVLYRVWEVGPTAHVRYDARARTYDYHLHTQPDPFLVQTSSYYAIDSFDTAALTAALGLLTGDHDFRAFCLTPDRHNTTTCALREASFHEEGEGRYRFRFVADRFLRGMIRILVFQLLRVAAGELDPARLATALASGERVGIGQARPEGLFLSRVEY